MTLPLRAGRGGALNEPAPKRKHRERQVGETYPDALSRVAGERDAALQDVSRLQAEVMRLRGNDSGPCSCCEIGWPLCRGLVDKGYARCCSDCSHDLSGPAT